tara:strand:+ start:64 stop:255 length:192 start_codon:yes stop_codon:yes gene_type:complete
MKKKLNVIDKIENARSRNNKNWMDLLRIAYENDSKKTAKILSKIYKEDKRISNFAKKLIRKKK